jgi:hypothetical protein
MEFVSTPLEPLFVNAKMALLTSISMMTGKAEDSVQVLSFKLTPIVLNFNFLPKPTFEYCFLSSFHTNLFLVNSIK